MESISLYKGNTIPQSFAQGCTSLKSINLPQTISIIDADAFNDCSSLEKIDLPKGLKNIKKQAFENTGLTYIKIPSSTIEIEYGVFNGCTSLSKIEAEDGTEVLSLGYNNRQRGGMFCECPLVEVTIGRNLSYNTTSNYGYSPFYHNTSIETVTLTDIPTEIFTNEFYGCTSLRSVSIGDGVAKIGDFAFSGCSSLETFTFGKSMIEIGKEAFSDCTKLKTLYAEPTTPPACGTQALDDINKWDCTLYVPEDSKSSYQSADQWKEFFFIEAYDFGNPDIPIEPEICEMPIISIVDGKLNIQSTTTDAVCSYNITSEDVTSGQVDEGENIELSGRYTITAYASKPGLKDSETVEAILVWVNPSIYDPSGVISMEAKKAVVIRKERNGIVVCGTERGEKIEIYDLGGLLLDSAIANDGETTIPSNFRKGDIVILRYDNETIKVKF